jgi:hypothetical protein
MAGAPGRVERGARGAPGNHQEGGLIRRRSGDVRQQALACPLSAGEAAFGEAQSEAHGGAEQGAFKQSEQH